MTSGKGGKGTGEFPRIPDLEEGMAILMGKVKDLAPTPPDEGPPLPKVLELKWPKALSGILSHIRIRVFKD